MADAGYYCALQYIVMYCNIYIANATDNLKAKLT